MANDMIDDAVEFWEKVRAEDNVLLKFKKLYNVNTKFFNKSILKNFHTATCCGTCRNNLPLTVRFFH